jgi:hypothetical protein
MGGAENQRSGGGLACFGVKWRATADEDGHYCFAVTLMTLWPKARLDIQVFAALLRGATVDGLSMGLRSTGCEANLPR